MNTNKGYEAIILSIISSYAQGATLGDIISRLDTTIEKRTLQRRLHRLVEKGQLSRRGLGRATRYIVTARQSELTDVSTQGYFPLRPESEAIRQAISTPLRLRKAVNYRPDFLYDYIPNKSFYLDPALRAHLQAIGKQPQGERPAATFAHQILGRLLIDLSWNSSRLEGNTYSLLETERLIEVGEAATGKALFETRMILNHKAAIEFLVELGEDLGFNRYVILNLHALLANNLLSDPRAAGSLRTIPVGIGKTVYTPVAIPQKIKDYFELILEKAEQISDPFEQSFFAMVHLPYLQPFVDVNKRVSRLAANIPLIKHNYCPISFVDMPERAYIDGILGVYELNSVALLADVYTWAYERSTLRYSETRAYLTEPNVFAEKYDKFIKTLITGLVRDLKPQQAAINAIKIYAKENVPSHDQERFVEMVETELLALHEGNIAKYKIKPMEYQAWTLLWHLR
jgi:Fic family protein